MKLLETVLFAAFCCFVIWLAFDSNDGANTSIRPDGTGPNPMKVNVEQFNRIEPDFMSKTG